MPRQDRVLGLRPRAGIIAVGGPPFAGRAVLAALLSDYLPNSVKLETVERLTRELFFPYGHNKPAASRAFPALLEAATERLSVTLPSPVIILCARFGAPRQRKLAQGTALAAGASFLYVEARSSNIRAIRRFCKSTALGNPAKQLAAYEEASQSYQPLQEAEMQALPALRLQAVLSDPDAACSAVLSAWLSM